MRGLVETIYYTNTSGVSEFLAVNMDDGSKIRMRGFLLCPKIGAKLCFEDLTKDPDGCTVFRKTYLLLETREEASRILCGADGISKKTADKIIDVCGIFLCRPSIQTYGYIYACAHRSAAPQYTILQSPWKRFLLLPQNKMATTMEHLHGDIFVLPY